MTASGAVGACSVPLFLPAATRALRRVVAVVVAGAATLIFSELEAAGAGGIFSAP